MGVSLTKHTARVFLSECRARRQGHVFWFALNAAQRARARLFTCPTTGTTGPTGPVCMSIQFMAISTLPGLAGETAQSRKGL